MRRRRCLPHVCMAFLTMYTISYLPMPHTHLYTTRFHFNFNGATVSSNVVEIMRAMK